MASDTPIKTGQSLLDFNQLFDNPVFAGGFGLASLGAVLTFARRGAISTANLMRRRLLVNVEISRQDPAYPWILAWLSQPRQHTSFLAKRLTRINELSITTVANTNSSTGSPSNASFFLQPGYGRHIVKYKNTYIAVSRTKQSTAKMNTGEPHETILLTTLYAHRHIFEDVFTEAHASARQAVAGKTVIYSVRNFDWVPLGEARWKRPLDSVVLAEGLKESIVGDVQDFVKRRQWIPAVWAPGTGKTSFIHALAGELDYNVAMVNLSEVGVTDDKLAFLLSKVPERTIILLEDVDSAFVNRTKRASDGYSGPTVTYSGLLNALDGLMAGEDRIAFLTTNHIELLDPALIRPGRVDMMVRIGEATSYQAAALWDKFYGDVDTDGKGRERFLARLEGLGLFAEPKEGEATPIRTSTAAIQGLFLFHKDDMEGAIATADALVMPPKTGESK
ncbi:putative BCS1 protein precursor [Apiospora kogelbergensis]|uniref:BCS1 protein n=1 Tax=Apiospora kogelbergensis TaxID=1337665 RepID=A0AAW0R219_9PEZI